MITISNDNEFRIELNKLSVSQQRAVAALFVENVLSLYEDDRIKRAVKLAENPATAEDELQMAHKMAKAASVESYTRCGADGDWRDQAGHFVAKAAATCVAPGAKENLAWDVAMYCRMARTCTNIARDESSESGENEAQYQLLSEFVG
ncbi:hypothetical protein [Thioflexithrix psekupsensis]|uniref:Uncharacterized protein n=1 Tax=Thioflexithrix psekupsensis TaxID=1570016 RepID=A0A251X485_9GAMM|nr:hypothetical protein [Thioflexithrix psekupsensis]OUD12200.1 hypothetical protein TPSD3_13845 [Thioflexithrix psekupsensis]